MTVPFREFRRRLSPFIFAMLVAVPPVAAQVVVTPETTVPLDTPTESFVPSYDLDVAAGGDGRALAIWTERPVRLIGGNGKRTVASRTFTPGGGALGNTTRQTIKGFARLVGASAALDAYLTTWLSGPENSELQAFSRGFAADGQPRGAVSQLSGELGGSALNALAVDGNDTGYIVAWGVGGDGVFARRVATDGSVGSMVGVDAAPLIEDVAVANTADGGFVVVFTRPAQARGFTAAGAAKAPLTFAESNSYRLKALAASLAGDVLAAVFLDANGGASGWALIVQSFTSTGTLLGPPEIVHELMSFGDSDAAFDRNGNLYVVWSEPNEPVRARAYDQNGQAVGPAVDIGSQGVDGIATARAPGGFVNLWPSSDGTMRTNVVSLCVPGSAVCGDGVPDPFCEMCDTGSARSDIDPDACRTDCARAHCGDGVVDSGEDCDDGNTAPCDGCNQACDVEVGLGCGDGIAFPRCGETCDDGNADDGDGCATCTLERVPGGGSSGTDCFAAWSIDNPTNQPRYAASGAISGTQACTDDDPRCDFDGGVPGSCTFHVQVCVNNTDQPACIPGVRLASLELRKPSPAQAAKHPEAAAIRAALNGVTGSVVGTSDRDICSPAAAIPIALRGEAGSYAVGRAALTTRATLYDGRSDTDKLRLECRPAP